MQKDLRVCAAEQAEAEEFLHWTDGKFFTFFALEPVRQEGLMMVERLRSLYAECASSCVPPQSFEYGLYMHYPTCKLSSARLLSDCTHGIALILPKDRALSLVLPYDKNVFEAFQAVFPHLSLTSKVLYAQVKSIFDHHMGLDPRAYFLENRMHRDHGTPTCWPLHEKHSIYTWLRTLTFCKTYQCFLPRALRAFIPCSLYEHHAHCIFGSELCQQCLMLESLLHCARVNALLPASDTLFYRMAIPTFSPYLDLINDFFCFV